MKEDWVDRLVEHFGGYLNPVSRPSVGTLLTLEGGCNDVRKRRVITPTKDPINIGLPPRGGDAKRRLRLRGLIFCEPGLGGPGDSGSAVSNENGDWVGIYIGATPAVGPEKASLISPSGEVLKQLGF